MKALKEQVEKLQLRGAHTATNESTTAAVERMVDGKVDGAVGAMPEGGATAGAAVDANMVTFSKQKLALLQSEYNPKACSHCKKSLPVDQLKKCNRCQVAKYCSRPCQGSDWKQKHKRHCKEMLRLNEAICAGGNAIVSPASDGALNGKPIQLEQGPQYYQACIDGNKLIVLGKGPSHDAHTVVLYDTNTGEKIASHVEFQWMEEVVAMCIAKNKHGESLLVVSINALSGWRLEVWSADFARPQLLDTPYPLPGPAGPLCFIDGMLLVVNMAKKCIEEYSVGSTRIKCVGGCIIFVERTCCLYFDVKYYF